MSVCELVVEHDGDGIVLLLELVVQALGLVLWHLESGPAIPLEGRRLCQAAQTADQSTRGHGHVVLALIGALDSDGKTVGDEEKASFRGLGPYKPCGFVGHVCEVCAGAVWRGSGLEEGSRLSDCWIRRFIHSGI